jgi:predicted ribosome quality control (RQC) complex YloA/Tae2 family protein
MLKLSEMLALSREIKRDLEGAVFAHYAEAGERTWVLTFSNSQRILIAACPPFNRFHLSTRSVATHPTPFTRGVEERLKGGVLKDVQMLGEDRILDLCFLVKGQELHLVVELCIRHPKVFLMDSQWKILFSREPITESHYQLPEKKGTPVLEISGVVSSEIESRYAALEIQAAFSERVKQGEKQLKARLKKMEARLIVLQEESAVGTKWEKTAHEAELLKSQFAQLKRGMKEIEVEDWQEAGAKVTIALDPSLEPQEQLKRRYKLSRKLKKRQELSHGFVADLENEIRKVKALLEEGSQLSSEEALGLWEKKAGVQKRPSIVAAKEKEHPFREFTTLAGRKIYVGKKDVDNDRLTFSFANGLDLWLHAANTPGSHVVLRVPKGEKIDDDSVKDALQLALHFSKARSRGADEVVMTECKYIAKARGAPSGQVNLSRHQTIYVKLDPVRLQRLLGKKAL